ncbi:hypothetical protein [Mycolicibacterium mucogenicum]|uniref:Capsid maturation protease and MuF-like fusion protein n=1 Tax=Mycolicibacterium mucogenicum DSM 44124 TaxID=1226753 RepID=A0A8H2J8X8_MYCMU|nr:hypothetical protein [Mycolicibacterium mucogenicum]KAB7761187.1 hypothetical protein MMUC44124_00900 [Mycolicibacterium mucogenicum DSM 44124]QPG69991.1 hypothetical protein C1S78_002890 [Mycolicibacterium mucogenicum DSM 44124]
MWPLPNEVLAHTVLAERAIEGLYAEALRRWAPSAKAAALPTLGAKLLAAGASYNGDPNQELPPDAAAVEQQQAGADWATITEVVIVAGIALLFSAAVVEAMEGLGIPLPDIDLGAQAEKAVDVEPAVMRIVNNAVPDMGAADIRAAAGVVEATPALREARDAVLGEQRERAASTPASVAAKITAAVEAAEPAEGRAAAADMLDPAGEQMRKIAETAGHQAASVQNEATLTAAQQSEDAADLESVWLATLDGKTRPTHWAAWGQRVPIGTAFTVGAASLMFPGDPSGPPEEVKNCRCRLGILAKDEPLPGEVDAHTERLDGRDSVAINREGRTQAEEIERRAAQGNTRARDNADGVGTVASGGWTAPSDQEFTMTGTSTMATDQATTDDTTESEMYRTFTDQAIALIGSPTSDGRMLAADIDLSFRSFPLPLMWCKQSQGGHMDAYTVGVIENARIDGEYILGSGYLLNTPEADEMAMQNSHGVSNPSVDLADAEWMYTDAAGNALEGEDLWDAFDNDEPVYMTVTKAELIGTTMVATPAFDTRLSLDAERSTRDVAIVASAAEDFRPRVYDYRMFEDPQLTGPTPVTMGDDGRIFGHLAVFGQCHRSIQDSCVLVPRSSTGYANFHTSPPLRLDNGTRLSVGRLTVGTGHADPSLAAGPALAHYDNTGTCWALVRVGEDAHGIWFSGVAAPGATAEQIEMGLSAPISGDWRDRGQGLELIAALAVNTPGFAVRGRTDDAGREVALVASMSPRRRKHDTAPVTLEQVAAVMADVLAEDRRRAALAAEREAALAQATELVGEPPKPKSPNDEIAELLAGAV